MKTLLNLYWNIMFYCTYTLLFYLFNRLLNPICFLSFLFWLIYKTTKVNVIQLAFNNMLVLSIFFVIICMVMYITNYLFLFKKSKYELFFVKFNTEKKHTLYYGIYLFSLIVQCILVWIMIRC